MFLEIDEIMGKEPACCPALDRCAECFVRSRMFQWGRLGNSFLLCRCPCPVTVAGGYLIRMLTRRAAVWVREATRPQARRDPRLNFISFPGPAFLPEGLALDPPVRQGGWSLLKAIHVSEDFGWPARACVCPASTPTPCTCILPDCPLRPHRWPAFWSPSSLSVEEFEQSLGDPFIYLFIWLHRTACGILIPRPGVQPMPTALEVQSLNHWTAREVFFLLKYSWFTMLY